MKNIREIVANNIVTLRKQNGYTQIELSEKINYSDKAISRWEKGEVLPDIETLDNLANIFDVPLSYMLEEHQDAKPISNNQFSNKLAVALVSISVVWLVATIVFVYLKMFYQFNYWQVFIWAVPASVIIGLYFCRKWGNKLAKTILTSLLVWTVVAGLYLQFIQYNLWLLFLGAVPMQVVIILASFLKPKKR